MDRKDDPMSHKLSDLKGIDQDLVAKLHAAGIQTANDMMQAWLDPDLRAKVMATAGLDEEQLKDMVSMARMARTRGIGPKYAHILVTAGVIGRKSLSKHTPQGLVKRLAEVSASRQSPGPVPTVGEVETWLAALKPQNAPLK
jgi:predicted flap endonuclease-1-like 5' DNA nuclease